MVGVPRSKGCQTCLRRRVKCNEERPTCGQCKKTGYRCSGYDKEITFHNQIVKPGPIESALVHYIKPPSQETTADDLVVLASQFLEISCPRELDLSAFEDKFMLTCLFTNYVRGNFGSPWLDLVAQGKLGVTSRTASLAVASEYFAEFHSQPKFRVPAAELYGSSLRLMRKELVRRDESGAERFIFPIMTMIMYDFLSWESGMSCDHFYGLSHVVELSGPDRFQIEPYQSAFESAREILILQSLHNRKHTFFERREWKSIPWANNLAMKSPANRLIDILADVPGLLEGHAKAMKSADATDTVVLRERVLTYLSQLYKWRWTWEAENPDAASETVQKPTVTDQREAFPVPFKTRLQFTNHVPVNEIGLYNSIQMFLFQLLLETGGLNLFDSNELLSGQLEQAQTEGSKQNPLLLLPGEATSTWQLAVEILRSFEYQLTTFYEQKDSILAWILPMGLAHQVFSHDTENGACLALSTKILASAPFSFRHACLYIAQSINIFSNE